MGLLRKLGLRMKDPVDGTAEVVTASAHSGRGVRAICELSLVVKAKGVEPTAVEHNQAFHRDRWPEEGMRLPVLVDRADPTSLMVKAKEVSDVEERNRAKAEVEAAAKASRKRKGKRRRKK